MCSLGSNWQYIIIGSDNGLAPNRWQGIIWMNDGLVNWRKYASLGFNELMMIKTISPSTHQNLEKVLIMINYT